MQVVFRPGGDGSCGIDLITFPLGRKISFESALQVSPLFVACVGAETMGSSA